METSTTDTQLYEIFREVTGKDKAEKTVSAIKNIVSSEVENQTQVLATGEQLTGVELRTSQQLSALELRMIEQLSALELRLNGRIHKSQFQTIFWIVSIGVLQFIASYLLRG